MLINKINRQKKQILFKRFGWMYQENNPTSIANAIIEWQSHWIPLASIAAFLTHFVFFLCVIFIFLASLD
jgi:hypothetical protein